MENPREKRMLKFCFGIPNEVSILSKELSKK